MKGERSPLQKDPLRQEFVEFIGTIDRPIVRQSVQEAVSIPLSEEFEENLPRFLDGYLDLSLLENSSPEWLDTSSFINEVFKANSVTFWDSISHHAEQKKPGVTGRVLFEIHRSNGFDREACDIDFPKAMSKQSLRFFGLATIYLGLGTIYGRELLPATRFSNNEKGFEERISRVLLAGKDVAQTFSTQPQDAAEIIERMHEVFSPDTYSLRNAYEALLTHHAFGEKVKGKPNHSCLGIELTKDIFRSYADILTTPKYQQHFIQTVSK